jgi:rubrerythrin
MENEQSKTLEAVKIAIQMEIEGKTFYQKASEASKNELGNKLFHQLALEEDLHRKRFEDIYKKIQAKNAWPEVDLSADHGKELKGLFTVATDKIKASASELEAVQTAMDMENKTRDFYREQAKTATVKAEKSYYETLVVIEGTHHAVLYDYFEYLKDPAGWFTMKERHSLDGG